MSEVADAMIEALYRVIEFDDGQAVPMDVWAKTSQCLRDMLVLPGCTRQWWRWADRWRILSNKGPEEECDGEDPTGRR